MIIRKDDFILKRMSKKKFLAIEKEIAAWYGLTVEQYRRSL
jgi:predicted transcriptional regulator